MKSPKRVRETFTYSLSHDHAGTQLRLGKEIDRACLHRAEPISLAVATERGFVPVTYPLHTGCCVSPCVLILD